MSESSSSKPGSDYSGKDDGIFRPLTLAESILLAQRAMNWPLGTDGDWTVTESIDIDPDQRISRSTEHTADLYKNGCIAVLLAIFRDCTPIQAHTFLQSHWPNYTYWERFFPQRIAHALLEPFGLDPHSLGLYEDTMQLDIDRDDEPPSEDWDCYSKRP